MKIQYTPQHNLQLKTLLVYYVHKYTFARAPLRWLF